MSAGLIVLCLPVPGLTFWVWNHLPVKLHAVTNIWPMQRLYLIAGATALFAVALALRCIPSPSGKNCRWAWIGVAGVMAWTTWQATPLLAGGFRQRWSEEATRRNYLPSNLDLTSTSYAFGGAPPSFVTGVMDPLLEFQFVGADGRGLPS